MTFKHTPYTHCALRAIRRLPVRGLHWLAGALIFLALAFQLHSSESLGSASAYDSMVKRRLFAPAPDTDIVIVDIDEASLAKLSDEYGRWPWPRDTLGAALNHLERSGAVGVVFDILMSDPDRQNPAADEAFAQIVAQSTIAWFPVLRLNPVNDSASTLTLSQLKGFAQASTDAVKNASIAAIPPFFSSALASKRLGFHNVYPDADSVIRSYRYREFKDGWSLNALPASIAQAQGWALPSQFNALINWPKPSARHTTVPFYQVLDDSLRKIPQLSSDVFKGKWVIVGSTAPSLHDIKATPLKAIQPGVEVLAIALDNAKNNTYLYTLPSWLIALITALTLLSSIALVKKYSQAQLSFAFIFIPSVLLALSFASLHIGRYFIDLTVPAQAAFFMLACVKWHAHLLSWAHAHPDLLHLEYIKGQTLIHQTVIATPLTAQQTVLDWSIFEALRQHTGVLYLDKRADNHPLSDPAYTWWTIIRVIPKSDGASVLKNSFLIHPFFKRVDTTYFYNTVAQALCFNRVHSEPVFSESSASRYFWLTLAQHKPTHNLKHKYKHKHKDTH